MKKCLIIGSSGIVGYPLSKHLILHNDWKVYGVARKDYDSRPKEVELVICDISSEESCMQKLASLEGITHIFYVTWSPKGSEEEQAKSNKKMFQNVLQAVQKKSAETLVYVYLQTGTKYYGVHVGPEKGLNTPVHEDVPRLDMPNFYYDQEDFLVSESKGKNWTWNICRPPTIIGYTQGTAMNFGVSLAVYAVLMKEMGNQLIWPYSQKAYSSLREFADVSVLCQFILFLAPDEYKKGTYVKKPQNGQAFNIHNGDYVRMKQVWPKVAEYFGMEAKVADKPFSVQEFMKDKDDQWNKVVAKYNLRKQSLKDLATWDFFDFTLGREWDELSVIQKAVKNGFTGQMDNVGMFVNFFDGLSNFNVIPKYPTKPYISP
jgi:nucleoside-diphosphate-sugar epimerase